MLSNFKFQTYWHCVHCVHWYYYYAWIMNILKQFLWKYQFVSKNCFSSAEWWPFENVLNSKFFNWISVFLNIQLNYLFEDSYADVVVLMHKCIKTWTNELYFCCSDDEINFGSNGKQWPFRIWAICQT